MTLLVTAEQGLGDTLQFVRARGAARASAARDRPGQRPGAARCACSPRVPGVSRVFGPGEPLPRITMRMSPLLSLAGALGIDAATIPAAVPYLAASRERRADVAALLSPHAGRAEVGLAWAGNRAHSNDRRRSMPLAALAPLFDVPGIAWFSLQPIADDEEIARRAGGARPRAPAGAQRLRRHGGAHRRARSRRHRRHEHRPSRRRARASPRG